jgi:hypothetical protein
MTLLTWAGTQLDMCCLIRQGAALKPSSSLQDNQLVVNM